MKKGANFENENNEEDAEHPLLHGYVDSSIDSDERIGACSVSNMDQ